MERCRLPLVNDVQAAGMTPMDLRQHLTDQLAEYIPSPEVSVIVRECTTSRWPSSGP
jgi:polysaccharide export outer membrane protein